MDVDVEERNANGETNSLSSPAASLSNSSTPFLQPQTTLLGLDLHAPNNPNLPHHDDVLAIAAIHREEQCVRAGVGVVALALVVEDSGDVCRQNVVRHLASRATDFHETLSKALSTHNIPTGTLPRGTKKCPDELVRVDHSS